MNNKAIKKSEIISIEQQLQCKGFLLRVFENFKDWSSSGRFLVQISSQAERITTLMIDEEGKWQKMCVFPLVVRWFTFHLAYSIFLFWLQLIPKSQPWQEPGEPSLVLIELLIVPWHQLFQNVDLLASILSASKKKKLICNQVVTSPTCCAINL